MPMHRVIADEPFTVELPTSTGGAIYVRASIGEIEHITAVHPLVQKTGRTLLLVSTHAGFTEQVEFFRSSLDVAELDGMDGELEAAVTDVLCRALLDSTALIDGA
jgi:hypothetical protein